MRVRRAWHRSIDRPYRKCIIGITIWSFLTVAIFSFIPSGYPSQLISPRSRFCEGAQIEVTKEGVVLHKKDKFVSKEFKRSVSALLLNYTISKILTNDDPFHVLREYAHLADEKHIRLTKIPKENGIYITHVNGKGKSPRIFHYFIDEEDSHTGKFRVVKDDFGRILYYREDIEEKEFKALKDEIKVFFTPEGHCAKAIIESIDSAVKSIDVAIYEFDNDEILDALKRAKARHVKIRIHVHDEKTKERLKKYGFDVSAKQRKSGLMHDKFMIIDDETVFSGSYNWTLKAETNRENLIVLPCVEPFKEEFEIIYNNKKDKKRSQRDTAPPPQIDALFSPDGRCNDRIKNLISQAIYENSIGFPGKIQIALFFFTDDELAEKLFEAKESGLDVEIILDKKQISRKDSAVIRLAELQEKADRERAENSTNQRKGSLKIKYHRIENVTMHNKFAIIGHITITGSYNWTKSAWQKNNENLITVPFILEEYSKEFERLWKESVGEVNPSKAKHLLPPSTAPPDYVIKNSTTENVPQNLEGVDVKAIKTFKDKKHEVRKVTNRFVLWRALDLIDANPNGRYTTSRDNLEESPDEIISRLRLYEDDIDKPYNKAKYRLPLIVEPGTELAVGVINGGTAWQAYILTKYMPDRECYKNKYVILMIQHLEMYDNESKEWIPASREIIRKLKELYNM